jgi:hypothetical protein
MKKIELKATEIPAEEAAEIIAKDYSALKAAIDAFVLTPFTMQPPQPKN